MMDLAVFPARSLARSAPFFILCNLLFYLLGCHDSLFPILLWARRECGALRCAADSRRQTLPRLRFVHVAWQPCPVLHTPYLPFLDAVPLLHWAEAVHARTHAIDSHLRT